VHNSVAALEPGQLIAVFDTTADAEAALQVLVGAGLAAATRLISPGNPLAALPGAVASAYQPYGQAGRVLLVVSLRQAEAPALQTQLEARGAYAVRLFAPSTALPAGPDRSIAGQPDPAPDSAPTGSETEFRSGGEASRQATFSQ
jgi:hypothetical protein